MSDIAPGLFAKVMASLHNKKFSWRTVRGLAKETSIPQEVILRILQENAEHVVKSSVPSKTGEDLYIARDTFATTVSAGAKLLGALKWRAR